jgi:HEAT repeat protein
MTPMRLFPGRRAPNVARLRKRDDVDGLIGALDWSEPVGLGDGRTADLGVGVRREAAAALAGSGSPAAVQGLLVALGDADEEVRLIAVAALRARGGVSAAQALGAASAAWRATPYARARAAAVAGAVASRSPEALRTHVDALLAGDAPLDDGARDDLEDLVSSQPAVTDGWGVVAEALRDRAGESVAPREAAVLAWIGPRLPLEPLLSALEDPARRAWAAVALGFTRDRRAREPLRDLLDADAPGLRRAAVEAIGRLKDPAALAALVGASYDDTYEVRDAALTALNEFGVVAVAASMMAATQPTESALPAPPPAAQLMPDARPAPPAADRPPTASAQDRPRAPGAADAGPRPRPVRTPDGLIPRLQRRLLGS